MYSDIAISVQDLRKTYKDVVAVDSISFDVYKGEVLGMVGPNGAGKTTTIECVEGMRRPDGGEISVLGQSVRRQARALRPRIGVQLQAAALPPRMRVWETLDLYTAFYPRTVDWRVLLERLHLQDKINAPFAKLSGGQKQRLFIALALINDPEIVFLDELTTGLDPHARHAMWDLVREIQGEGKTVFLTTHFMEEAERLCDRVAIVDHGRLVALDKPANLIREHGGDSRVVVSADGDSASDGLANLEGVTRVDRRNGQVVVHGRGARLVARVVMSLAERGCEIHELRTEQPNLEDVFLKLTGRAMRE